MVEILEELSELLEYEHSNQDETLFCDISLIHQAMSIFPFLYIVETIQRLHNEGLVKLDVERDLIGLTNLGFSAI